MQVQHQIKLSFASGVRSLLRQDPDIIMVGEIRDLETAEMAIQAALTGHLVISTLHTNDAPSAVTRMIDLGVAPYLIKATVIGVMAQRLVRTLCPHCKQPEERRPRGVESADQAVQGAAAAHFMKPVGCLECRDTGYLGRMGVYEIMLLTEALRQLIKADTDIDTLRLQGIKDGMRTLRLSGAQKVGAGLTTIAEVLRVTPSSQSD